MKPIAKSVLLVVLFYYFSQNISTLKAFLPYCQEVPACFQIILPVSGYEGIFLLAG